MADHPIGSEEWLRRESMWGERGKAHAALRLLLQEKISTRRCLELLYELSRFPRAGAIQAPWDELDWNPANDPAVVLREILAVEKEEDWRAIQAKIRELE